MLPYVSKVFIGKEYDSFSKIINHAIVSAENEIVIICSYKTRPKSCDIDRMLNYINDGYGLVALYRFAFFGFFKELIRRIGFMDERYIGGYEDCDFLRRLVEYNISYIEEESIEYIFKPSLWQGTGYKFFEKKYKQDGMILYKYIPEEKYNYDIGSNNKDIIFKDKSYSRSFSQDTLNFILNINIVYKY